jgi:hypothetical protein
MSTSPQGKIAEGNVQRIVDSDFSLPEPQGLVDIAFLNLTNDLLHEIPKSYRCLRRDNDVQRGVAGEGVAIDWMKPETRTGSVEELGCGEFASGKRWECRPLKESGAGARIRLMPHVKSKGKINPVAADANADATP